MTTPTRVLLSVVALVLALVLALTGPAGAQTWELEYDASLGTLPSAQGFAHVSSDPAPDDGLDETTASPTQQPRKARGRSEKGWSAPAWRPPHRRAAQASSRTAKPPEGRRSPGWRAPPLRSRPMRTSLCGGG